MFSTIALHPLGSGVNIVKNDTSDVRNEASLCEVLAKSSMGEDDLIKICNNHIPVTELQMLNETAIQASCKISDPLLRYTCTFIAKHRFGRSPFNLTHTSEIILI